jgi:hypothetical protein
MADEIIREVWRAKDRLAQEFNHDIAALAAELRKQQNRSGRRVVNLAKPTATQGADRPQ